MYVARWPDGFQVQWRNLTWKEYKTFKYRYDRSIFSKPMDIAMDIYKQVYINGPHPTYVPAGIPLFICTQQMQNNPFSGRYEDLAPALRLARNVVANDYLLSAKAMIAVTLNYKPEEMDNWDPNTFFERLAQAEIATGKNFELVDPRATTTNAPPQTIKKPLTTAQQKAIERTKERGRG
jgi:hypothetical protein